MPDFNLWMVIVAVYLYMAIAFTSFITISKNLGKISYFLLFDIPTLVKETLGVILRTIRRRPTLSKYRSPSQFFSMLGLPSYLNLKESVSASDIVKMAEKYKASMDKEPWTYPDSQRQIFMMLYSNALDQVKLREALFKAHQARTKASQSRAKSSSGREVREPSKRSSSWRKVLGVGPAERDPAVIKKAYRKLVSKAHPDKGGTGEDMPVLNEALTAARRELKFV